MRLEAGYIDRLASYIALESERLKLDVEYSEICDVPETFAGLKIKVPGFLDLKSTLECGQAFRWRKVCGPDACIWYKGVLGSTGVMVRFDTSSSKLLVLYDDKIAETHHALAWEVFNYFSLDDDLKTIYQFLAKADAVHARAGAVMQEAIRHACGLRILRQGPWECLVSYIVSTNKNIPAISKIIQHFCSAMGSPAGLGEYTFPSPERFLAAGLDGIRRSKCGYRAPYILDAAAKVLNNEVNLDELSNMPTKEARQQLQTIKGVGPKVADCVLLFGYHRLDVFPVDVWIARSMSHFYMGGNNVTPKSAREEGRRRFGPFAGYAQQYLFNYARNVFDKEAWPER